MIIGTSKDTTTTRVYEHGHSSESLRTSRHPDTRLKSPTRRTRMHHEKHPYSVISTMSPVSFGLHPNLSRVRALEVGLSMATKCAIQSKCAPASSYVRLRTDDTTSTSHGALCIVVTGRPKAPDKGEVGGSSPPRPTIQTNIYAAILTFPFQGTCHQKTVLPKICQIWIGLVGHCPGRSGGRLPTIAPWSMKATTCGVVRGRSPTSGSGGLLIHPDLFAQTDFR
jgi:hypothetical protein